MELRRQNTLNQVATNETTIHIFLQNGQAMFEQHSGKCGRQTGLSETGVRVLKSAIIAEYPKSAIFVLILPVSRKRPHHLILDREKNEQCHD